MSKRGSTETWLVTGGGGYAGYRLGKKIAEIGHHVILYDIIDLQWPLLNGMKYIQVNMCSYFVWIVFFICVV